MNGSPAFDAIPDPLPARRPESSAPEPPPRLLALADLEEPRPRDQACRSRLVALAASVLWLGAHLAAYGIRRDLHQVSTAYVALEIVPPFTLAVATLIAALRPGLLGLGLDPRWGASWAALAPAVFWCVALAASPP